MPVNFQGVQMLCRLLPKTQESFQATDLSLGRGGSSTADEAQENFDTQEGNFSITQPLVFWVAIQPLESLLSQPDKSLSLFLQARFWNLGHFFERRGCLRLIFDC